MRGTKTFAIYTKLISFILILLLVFNFIPGTVYAEVVGAFSIDEEAAKESTRENGESLYEYEGRAYEVEELREENAKHFRLSDGSYVAAQYPTAVHYENENGEWVDIDNRLFSFGSDYSSSDARIKFSKKITGNSRLYTLHDGNLKITMSLIGAVKGTEGAVYNNEDAEEETELQKLINLEKLSSRIVYENILPSTDIEYIVSGNSIN